MALVFFGGSCALLGSMPQLSKKTGRSSAGSGKLWSRPAAKLSMPKRASVGQAADPQTDTAIRLVVWIPGGTLQPAPKDFAMVRVIVLAVLSQMDGILVMVARRRP